VRSRHLMRLCLLPESSVSSSSLSQETCPRRFAAFERREKGVQAARVSKSLSSPPTACRFLAKRRDRRDFVKDNTPYN